MTNINALRNMLKEKENKGYIKVEDFDDCGINIYLLDADGSNDIWDALDGHDNIEFIKKFPEVFEDYIFFYIVDGVDVRMTDLNGFNNIPAKIANEIIDYYMYEFK